MEKTQEGAQQPLWQWVTERRAALRESEPTKDDTPGIPLPKEDIEADKQLWGLALSGGGIRSATFALGLVSGLARQGIFSRFDLLSTVSGGGYAGSALGKLYNGREAAPHRMQTSLSGMGATWFVWWLRATSRYLAPRGFKDLLPGLALYTRNLFAIHLEQGLAGLALGPCWCCSTWRSGGRSSPFSRIRRPCSAWSAPC